MQIGLPTHPLEHANSHMTIKLRITIVTNTFPAVSETFIFRKVMSLAAQGHYIKVLSHKSRDWDLFQDQLPLPSNIKLIVIPSLHRQKYRFGIFFIRQIARSPVSAFFLIIKLLRSIGLKHGVKATVLNLPVLIHEADIIHFEYLGLAATHHASLAVASSATVLSCRGADLHLLDQVTEPKRSHYISQLQRVSAIHCVSQEMADEVHRISGRYQHVYINRPAVMVNEIQPKANYHAPARPLIISTGRLVWKKGFDYLLAAYAQLRKEGIDFHAQIFGGGILEQGLRRAIIKLELQDVVEFIGRLSPHEVLLRLQAADLFVLSSHEEGISNAVLEAMATGLPIVTTNAGGMSEAVQDGVEGFVTPVRQPWVLADRIKGLLLDPELRERMGRAARKRVEADFSLAKQSKQFEEMYNSIIPPQVTQ